MKIALTIPSRGVVFAKTIQTALLSKELPEDTTFHVVDNLPIPLSHNRCIELAIEDGASHIFFVEDDMYIPEGVITTMIHLAEEGRPYVCCDYKMAKDTKINTALESNGIIWWTGFGCTLIDLSIFKKKGKPYLTADKEVRIDQMRPLKYTILNRVPPYGTFDILFGIWCRQNQIPLYVVPNKLVGHLRTESLIKQRSNNGMYPITDLSSVLDMSKWKTYCNYRYSKWTTHEPPVALFL